MASVKAVPVGYTTVTPSIAFRDAAKAIEFYKKAFGAKERERHLDPDGKIMHAEITIGNSIVMLSDEVMGLRSAESLGNSPVSFYVYIENVDAACQKAVAAGAKQPNPVADMFWGDRVGQVVDPFGYKWTIASHVKDLTPEQMKKGQEDWLKQMAGAR